MGKGRDDSDRQDDKPARVEVPNPKPPPLPDGWHRGPSGGPGNSD